MSYIGSTPTTQNFIAGTDQFTGDGSQTNWTLSRFVNSVNDIQVTVANVVQNPTSYSVSGNTLTISPAVGSAVVFYVRYLSTTLQSSTVPGGSAVNGTFLVAQDTYLATQSGNVGVGTTSPDSLANFKFVDVGSGATNQGVVQANNGTVKTAIYVNGTDGYVATRTNHNLNLQTNATTRATIDTSGNFQFNSGYGSVATAFGCRAWVNFNGTGTVAIRASGNVTSITDNGTGQYTVNLTTAMPDANFAVTTSTDGSGSGSVPYHGSRTFAVGSVQITTTNSGSFVDNSIVCVGIFR